jgi:hypothetical protein
MIVIEVAGIRRSVRLVFESHREFIDGKQEFLHDSVTLLPSNDRMPADWILALMGPRQRKEFDSHLLKTWKFGNTTRR